MISAVKTEARNPSSSLTRRLLLTTLVQWVVQVFQLTGGKSRRRRGGFVRPSSPPSSIICSFLPVFASLRGSLRLVRTSLAIKFSPLLPQEDFFLSTPSPFQFEATPSPRSIGYRNIRHGMERRMNQRGGLPWVMEYPNRLTGFDIGDGNGECYPAPNSSVGLGRRYPWPRDRWRQHLQRPSTLGMPSYTAPCSSSLFCSIGITLVILLVYCCSNEEGVITTSATSVLGKSPMAPKSQTSVANQRHSASPVNPRQPFNLLRPTAASFWVWSAPC